MLHGLLVEVGGGEGEREWKWLRLNARVWSVRFACPYLHADHSYKYGEPECEMVRLRHFYHNGMGR